MRVTDRGFSIFTQVLFTVLATAAAEAIIGAIPKMMLAGEEEEPEEVELAEPKSAVVQVQRCGHCAGSGELKVLIIQEDGALGEGEE